jgi:hypothetical protein
MSDGSNKASGKLTDSRTMTASLRKGIRIRFEMNPGSSREIAGSLPHARAYSSARLSVSGDVCRAGISSTSFITCNNDRTSTNIKGNTFESGEPEQG